MTKPLNHNFTCIPTIIFVLQADATGGSIAKPFQVRDGVTVVHMERA